MTAPTVLVKIGGAALLDETNLRRLAADLRAVHETGVRLLVVHGGGPQATALARQLGLEPDFRAGRRITDAAMLSVVKHALVGEAATTLLGACRSAGIPAVSMSASSGGLVVAN
ncbi:MAG TPA: acetylglutamate kinase, partial [Myxococcales bacterium]|nr:acetylglutamate kinase [Myxococcales bacterium]